MCVSVFFVRVSVHMCACKCVYMCTHVFCMCISVHVCMYTWKCVHTCITFFVCVSVHIYVCRHADVYTYIWRLKADVANQSWSLFYLINWGKVSQSNPELGHLTSFGYQACSGNSPNPCFLELELDTGCYAHLTCTWVFENLNSGPDVWVANALSTEQSLQLCGGTLISKTSLSVSDLAEASRRHRQLHLAGRNEGWWRWIESSEWSAKCSLTVPLKGAFV